MFDKSSDLFPVKNRFIFLSHCGIAPLYSEGLRRELEVAEIHSRSGSMVFELYDRTLDGLRQNAAELLRTSPENLSLIKNTSEGMSLIANGYPFRKGDQVISYVHEYPANFYPWKLQEKRGVEVLELPNGDVSGLAPEGLPGGWSMADLEAMVTKRTRLIALSHVHFASGFAFEVKRLGEFCRAHDIDLVIDAAQSLGCLPLYPEDGSVGAVVSSGWKWLMGPMGTGLLYTSPGMRSKLDHVMTGAELMRQGYDYLDHTWDPLTTSKRFEYSTSPISLAAALERCIAAVPLRYGIEAIRDEILRLQEVFMGAIDRRKYRLVGFPPEHRSAILSMTGPGDSQAMSRALAEQAIICTARGGYLRFAAHFYNTEDEVERAARALNDLV